MIEKRGGRYRARIYHRGRHVASRTFERKREALDWQLRQYANLAAGTWVDSSAGSRTVAEWGVAWLAARPPRRPKTEEKVRGLVERQVGEQLGRLPLSQLAPSRVQEWASGLAAEASPATARAALVVLRGIVGHAMRDGAIGRDPTVGVKVPKVQAGEPRPLTHSQVAQLMEGAGERDRALLLTLAYTGLRWSEATGLKWGDLSREGVRVSRQAQEGGGALYAPLKTHQARTVPVPKVVGEALVLWRQASEFSDADEPIFAGRTGRPLRNRNWRRDFLTPASTRVDRTVTPHELRDTAASLAIQAGASVVAVSRLLGHQSAATTLNHYAGMFPSDLDDVAARLDVEARRVM